MDDYMDMDCDDYFETHNIDDLMEWETEQVFQDMVAEREEFCEEFDFDQEGEWE